MSSLSRSLLLPLPAQVSGLQDYVRNHCRLAKLFEARVLTDSRFKVMNNVKVRNTA